MQHLHCLIEESIFFDIFSLMTQGQKFPLRQDTHFKLDICVPLWVRVVDCSRIFLFLRMTMEKLFPLSLKFGVSMMGFSLINKWDIDWPDIRGTVGYFSPARVSSNRTDETMLTCFKSLDFFHYWHLYLLHRFRITGSFLIRVSQRHFSQRVHLARPILHLELLGFRSRLDLGKGLQVATIPPFWLQPEFLSTAPWLQSPTADGVTWRVSALQCQIA